MDRLSATLAMGGYAAFVWPAYAVAGLGLIGALVQSWRGWKAREREFEQLKNAGTGQENP
jgi:heme exporter protein D